MGELGSDTDSDFLIEKGQTTNHYKRWHSPLSLIKQTYRESLKKREQPYRLQIEELRGHMTENREMLRRSQKGYMCWEGSESIHQRYAIWVSSSTPEHECYKFSPHHRYRITVSSTEFGPIKTFIHDFRTSKGRKHAFAWLDVTYEMFEKSRVKILCYYDKWEETYQRYIQDHHIKQREILLKGTCRIDWVETKVEQLAD
ncbi:hypothetical protein diail_11807 [Diaporthe ilicicola]|nr:hypothetical protein diail_11807 [Diaporthe ilicicola]